MKKFLVSTRSFGENVLAQAMLAPSQFRAQAAAMGKWEQRMWAAFFLCAASLGEASAQNTSVEAASEKVKTAVFTIAQALFAVFLVVQLVKVAKKFMSGEPDAMQSLFWLIGGVIIFFGFNALKTSIVGGGQAGKDTDTLIGTN